VFQAQGEGLSLAAALPDDQPLIGLKSVFLSRNGFDMSCMAYFLHDSYQEPVTTAYLADVMTALGDRPYVLGGNCSGAVTALHMALRAARRPRSLILLNYPTRPKPYDGPGLLIFGAKEWADFGAAAQASATFPGSRVALLPGGHGTYFKGSTLVELATLLSETTAPDADIAA
jgi:pimeloyl-ACP methyl ester carboxylesterase